MSKLRGIILIDGPDCSGKSTLAEHIKTTAEKLGSKAVVRHLGKPEPGTCWGLHKAALCAYVKEAFTEDTLVIADRHFLSEAIYGVSYREGSEYPFAARHVDRLLHRFRALRVICAPSVEFVVETHAKMKKLRVEAYDTGMGAIAQRYLDLWHGALDASGNPNVGSTWSYKGHQDYVQQLTADGGVADRNGWYHYNVETHGQALTSYVKALLDELESEQELIQPGLLDLDHWRFTGFPSQQSVLLVGDKIKSANLTHTPFLSNSNSSEYLASVLHKLHADESRVVVANINDEHGPETVNRLSRLCGRTIALGREAEKTLQLTGIRYHAKVRHPQHARRFSRYDQTYEQELRVAFAGMADVKSWREAA